ncbi:hypothetical protein PTSG_07909 [Salpingoeca rosetta]|uniref:Vacuolar protein sorting-associated protein 53 homolog n=1 Tax=Salpingoeca rosetta (strain ATCC 50818 / BSB-021) TaxID=946362 RepID=F2UGP1_SALR5|nr:uncharacterized protein PTSG_07909 [Salpingoeca rosetta]EGD75791.1 hypothetical protein PTSG_07909 [Salpingoeca rosetta]|eukprot:XP_004991712.1 hypothetical protein PTSG_07909 [Salpingoeca rosetta]
MDVERVEFDEEVEAAIAELFPSDDPLDDLHFDSVEYINSLFPNEQSLSSLDGTVARLKKKLRVVDEDIQSSIRSQTRAGNDGQQALEDAQQGMSELLSRIRNIRTKAETSEKMVQEITRDIKSLDNAKRNLTTSITTLNHLHMLVGGVDTLESMTKRRQYHDAANLLAAVINVLHHFDGYTNVTQVQELSRKVEGIKRALATQIQVEFKRAFRKPQPDLSETDPQQLTEACAVLDVLDADIKDSLVHWFLDVQLKDYRPSFHIDAEHAWLDKVDRRYAWFKRMMTAYREVCAQIFPESWHMPHLLARRFCSETHDQLKAVLAARESDIDVQVLLFAIKKTAHFENWLTAKFSVEEEEDEEEDEEGAAAREERLLREEMDLQQRADVASSEEERESLLRQKRELERQRRMGEAAATGGRRHGKKAESPFTNAIGKVFEDYLHVYVEAQDKNLEAMLDEFTKAFKSSLMFPEKQEEDEAAKELESSGDLFMFFRNCIMQCSSLTTGEPMYNLYTVFKKYLREYADRILLANLPKSTSLATLLVKEAELKLSMEEVYLVCSILNTADYCLQTTEQLEAKMKEKLDAPFNEQVNLTEEQDKFNEVITTCIQVLVRALETVTQPSLTAIYKTKWDQIEEVGDTSPFVSAISKHIVQMVPRIRRYFGNNRKYFTNFCLKFANAFVPKILSSLKKCKTVGTVGAEQLLLDTQSLKHVLTQLPSVDAAAARKPPAAYTRIVNRGLGQAETLLKLLMAPHDPPGIFVQDYTKLIGDDEPLVPFAKILDMKGLRKAEQQPLLAAYREQVGEAAFKQEQAAHGSSGVGGVAALGLAFGRRGGGDRNKKDKDASSASSSSATAAAESGSGKTANPTTSASTSPTKRGSINIRKLESLIKRFQ